MCVGAAGQLLPSLGVAPGDDVLDDPFDDPEFDPWQTYDPPPRAGRAGAAARVRPEPGVGPGQGWLAGRVRRQASCSSPSASPRRWRGRMRSAGPGRATTTDLSRQEVPKSDDSKDETGAAARLARRLGWHKRGGCEIRTREGLPPTRFPSVRPRPLGESSSAAPAYRRPAAGPAGPITP
jgi:hypothetical protein